MMLISITGGIGCGKSVAARIIDKFGYHVYDTDSNARRLMNEDAYLKKEIKRIFGDSIYTINGLDRRKLGSIVFNDPQKLKLLNSIVHPAVKNDLLAWMKKQKKLAFFETAIPYESGLDQVSDKIIKVEAPLEIRISRVKSRNNMSREDIIARINSQNNESRENIKDIILINDDKTPLIPQIFNILQLLK